MDVSSANFYFPQNLVMVHGPFRRHTLHFIPLVEPLEFRVVVLLFPASKLDAFALDGHFLVADLA